MDQQKWLVKLMGYDYEIEYRLGWDNIAVDALSSLHGELFAITYPDPTRLEAICLEAHNDPTLSAMRDVLKNGTIYTKGYEEKEGHLWYKGAWYYLHTHYTKRLSSMNFTIHQLGDILVCFKITKNCF